MLVSVGVSLYTLWLSEPGWDVSLAEATELWHMTPQQRASKNLFTKIMPREGLARLREEELVEGTVAAFVDPFVLPGTLWNESYSNRVVFVPWRSRADFLRRLQDERVDWIVVRDRSPQLRAIARSWQPLGQFYPGFSAFKRPQRFID